MINFNETLMKLNKQTDEEGDLVEKLELELQEAKERKTRLDERKTAEQANTVNKLNNQLAQFNDRFKPMLNGRSLFQVKIAEDLSCIEFSLAPGRIVARYGKDAINTPFKLLDGEYSGMSKKEDVDLSALKPQIYNLLETTFR